MTQYMGFEGKLYIGTAGSTAATLLTNVRDVQIARSTNKGNTTVRGDGTAPPVETQRVTRRIQSITWQMINDSDDTELETLRVADAAGTPVAVRMKDSATGKGFDGDCIIEISEGQPLDGEQTFDITAVPTRESGRDPDPYV